MVQLQNQIRLPHPSFLSLELAISLSLSQAEQQQHCTLEISLHNFKLEFQ
jgi:hypothetical protein